MVIVRSLRMGWRRYINTARSNMLHSQRARTGVTMTKIVKDLPLKKVRARVRSQISFHVRLNPTHGMKGISESLLPAALWTLREATNHWDALSKSRVRIDNQN